MTKTIAFALYPGCTPLDLVGPLQVLTGLTAFDPSYEVVVAGADTRTPADTDTPLRLLASHTFEQVPRPAVLVVPGGGEPTLAALADESLVGWIREAAPTADVVASVCSGSLLLGAAGLLEGRRATTHWGLRWMLPAFGAEPVAERWVESGPVLTGAGVAAGIDMALHLAARLAGEAVARKIQLMIEYDPEPPLGGIDWDSPDIAGFGPMFDEMVRTALADQPALLARVTERTGPAAGDPR
ncbi:DJ-1/PfpI family protein [Streptomyces armeniacus]|uniref:DJ-1/PfpI family protein n=1 Tax=Streptomyces armeniacus TaxID=83291 RepID=A0A345XUG3_9ACTN|nr:DJ-1/PfpI family protein [Streptomyces armeniacus]AXK35279.1 DJ-1/PfpI family protein [Streptomyces armeniacus]